MTGEHGDGIVRSCWLEKMYGPGIVRAFADVKRAFDPAGLLNPGKIVEPLPLTENLRYRSGEDTVAVKTHLDFSRWGGAAGLVEMCSGLGECRKRGEGTMCPSFAATRDETHTTRARANALRVALSNRSLLSDWTDPKLDGVMDLCIACKACKSECPTGVDMAAIKAEWLAAKHRRQGVLRRVRFVAEAARWTHRASRMPRVSNLLARLGLVRRWMHRRYGLDPRVPPPRLARTSFHEWFRRHQADEPDRRAGRGELPDDVSRPVVVYFADTWTRYCQPEIGIAAVRLLERCGYHVVAPRFECCGRPLISKGLLAEAKLLAEQNVRKMRPFLDRNWPIVATEPGCLSALVDEAPQLVRTPTARAVARCIQPIESFLLDSMTNGPGEESMGAWSDRSGNDSCDAGDSPGGSDSHSPSGHNLAAIAAPNAGSAADRPAVLYHGHCHEKALWSTDASLELLRRAGFDAREINSGCCGMAGSFGHEAEHYDVSRAIGEERLFPAVRDRGAALIVANGFSCRQQLAHHVGVHAKHVVQLLVGDGL